MNNVRRAIIATFAATLVMLSGVFPAAASHITLSPLQLISQPVGIDYNPTSGQLIVSSGWPGGSNLISIDPNTAAVSTFTPGTFGQFELKIAVSKGACAFPAGEVFIGNAYGTGTIGFFSATGSPLGSVTLPTVVSTTGFEFEDMGIVCDTIGTQFGGDLIAVTNDGRVFRINTSLSQTLVTNINEFLEGVTVAPVGFGPISGQIIITKEFAGTVIAVSNTATLTTVMSGLQSGPGTGVEWVNFVPNPAQSYFVDLFQSNTVARAPAGEFFGFEGDLVVASEFPGRVDIIAFDSGTSSFVIADTTDSFSQFEQTTFGPPSVAGCTPGFWKNHASVPPWPSAYPPSTTVVSVFSSASPYVLSSTDTLLTALSYMGGPSTSDAARILLRAGTAALLNSAALNGNYPLTTSTVISNVNAALSSANRNTMLTVASQLDGFNSIGCPFS